MRIDSAIEAIEIEGEGPLMFSYLTHAEVRSDFSFPKGNGALADVTHRFDEPIDSFRALIRNINLFSLATPLLCFLGLASQP